MYLSFIKLPRNADDLPVPSLLSADVLSTFFGYHGAMVFRESL